MRIAGHQFNNKTSRSFTGKKIFITNSCFDPCILILHYVFFLFVYLPIIVLFYIQNWSTQYQKIDRRDAADSNHFTLARLVSFRLVLMFLGFFLSLILNLNGYGHTKYTYRGIGN